jgi:hypothetical protein
VEIGTVSGGRGKGKSYCRPTKTNPHENPEYSMRKCTWNHVIFAGSPIIVIYRGIKFSPLYLHDAMSLQI